MANITAMIHVRVDHELKTNASRTLSKMGLSMSDAVRLLLIRIEADQALPFDIHVPNTKTRDAMQAGDQGEVVSFASIDD